VRTRVLSFPLALFFSDAHEGMTKRMSGMTHMELKKTLAVLLLLAGVQYLHSRSVSHSRRHSARTDRTVSRSNAAYRWDY
jgi:hypothetical protein